MNLLKETIKEAAAKQRELKSQRQTLNFIGIRTKSPSEASSDHYWNRKALREMYMALGLINGLESTQIEKNPKEPINMKNVNALIDMHAKAVRISS